MPDEPAKPANPNSVRVACEESSHTREQITYWSVCTNVIIRWLMLPAEGGGAIAKTRGSNDVGVRATITMSVSKRECWDGGEVHREDGVFSKIR